MTTPPVDDRFLVWTHDAEPPEEVRRSYPRLVAPGSPPIYYRGFDPAKPTPLPWVYQCNICGTTNERTDPMPATKSCARCLSNVRYRATVRALTVELLGTDLPLDDIRERKEIRGVGIGDWAGYARRLARLFSYVNTHLDTEPRLDLTAPPPSEYRAAYDFVVAGDVLEHVAPPVGAAIGHLRQLLKPGGVAVLTVPFRRRGEPVEHFPELHRYRIVERTDGTRVLVNERRDGTLETFTDLRFHVTALEMRKFTEASFAAALAGGGFESEHFVRDVDVEHGIVAADRAPVPVVARAPSTPC